MSITSKSNASIDAGSVTETRTFRDSTGPRVITTSDGPRNRCRHGHGRSRKLLRSEDVNDSHTGRDDVHRHLHWHAAPRAVVRERIPSWPRRSGGPSNSRGIRRSGNNCIWGANGEAPAYENGARLYRIPKTGILLTQRDLNVGISPAWRFFFEAVDGTRMPIQLVWGSAVPDTAGNRTDPTVGVFLLGRISQQAGRALQCAVTSDQYFVGTKAQLLARGQFRVCTS